jgi:DNA-binding GntR family transcriptional regulator
MEASSLALSISPLQRRKSLHEQTYEALRVFILSGELAPGERLVETQLAEQLSVSRTPIREALRQLQRETLLTADANGGLRIPTLSIDDAMQLYDCRIALEQLAVKESCANATDDEIQAIEHWVIQAEALGSDILTPANCPQMLEVDYCFHRAIASSTQNRWLLSMLDQLFDQMMLLRVQTTRHNPQVLDIREEHRFIFEAIACRNVDAAVQAIYTHLSASKQRVTQEVQALQRYYS